MGVSRTYGDRNDKVHKKAGIERVLASRMDQRVLSWLGNVERMYA